MGMLWKAAWGIPGNRRSSRNLSLLRFWFWRLLDAESRRSCSVGSAPRSWSAPHCSRSGCSEWPAYRRRADFGVLRFTGGASRDLDGVALVTLPRGASRLPG
jgi:hypothetical protein